MKFFKHILLFYLILFCFQKYKGQCMFMFPSGGYNCQTSQGYVTYAITSGGTPTFSITVINSLGVTVATGTSSTGSGTLTGLPVGNYTVIAVDAVGCSVINTGFSIVVAFNSSNIAFTSSLSCFGSNTGIASTNITGNTLTPPFTYTWSNGSNASTATNLAAGVYSVTVKDSQGCMVSNSVNVGQNTQILSTFNSTLVPCFNGTLSTSITSNGGTSPYTYSVNGLGLSTTTATNLSVGIKTITTKDANGCMQTNTVLLSQVTPPIINFTITKPSCTGSSNGAVTASVSNAPPSFTYTWQPAVSFTSNLQNIASGNYTVTVKDANACITKSVVNVSPAASMTITANTTPENCSAADGSATISVVGGNFPYIFNTLPIVNSSNILSNLTSGGYTTAVIDANNCKDTLKFTIGNLSTVVLSVLSSTPVLCFGNCDGKVQLSTSNAILPVTYSASGTPTTSSSLITNLCAGYITLKVIDAIGCPATATINFATPPAFSYTATQPPNSCFNKPITLQGSAIGGSGGYTFVWNPGNITGQVITLTPAASTVYSLNVYDSNGCTLAPFTVTATINPPINININTYNTGICPGTTAQITPTLSGGDGNYNYTWLPGNYNTPSIFVQNILVPTYTLIVNDGCGSPTATKIINLNLFPVIVPTYSVVQDTGCQPLCTQFINTSPKSNLAIWNYGDKPFEQIGNTTNYCYFSAGNFNLKLTIIDSNQCKTAYTYTNAIKVLESPLANFKTIPEILTLNNSDDITLKNTTNNAINYQWFAEGKNYGNVIDINHYQLKDTGCYSFILIATNQNNCKDTSTKSICVIEGFNFYMPNCFTPDDDNLNDVLLPKGTGFTTQNYSFEVFNRWGTRIFITNDITKYWDGKATADKYDPSNVYYWRIKITDNLGDKHLLSGYVLVLR